VSSVVYVVSAFVNIFRSPGQTLSVRDVPDHVLENKKVISDPFIHSSQTFPYVESRYIISE
jgi:hypothetical protein